MSFTAATQPVEETIRRAQAGSSFIAKQNGRIIGTITLYQGTLTSACEWYRNKQLGYFGQFAVDPSLQRAGLGRKLIVKIEEHARQKGFKELACDTHERATKLAAYYTSCGFRQVGSVQWDTKDYKSKVFSKNISN